MANRICCPINTLLKDGAILSNCADRDTQRIWIGRVHDHDGHGGDARDIEAWPRIADAPGITRDALWSLE